MLLTGGDGYKKSCRVAKTILSTERSLVVSASGDPMLATFCWRQAECYSRPAYAPENILFDQERSSWTNSS